MLKTVSSISNPIGALNYKGTWNASTNTPALSSGAGTKGDYYVVSVAGSTTLDGISNWGIGDWAAYNGSVWQRVEGGADLNGVNLSVTGTSTLSGLTASTALALNASKQVVSVTNTGTGNNVLATAPSITGLMSVSSAVNAEGELVAEFRRTGQITTQIYATNGSGGNAAATGERIAANGSTGRSINAGGTVNVGGLDYAEYMTKAGDFTIAKGDVVGVNAAGLLTNIYSEAISFVVKSTNPSYVGGDAWGFEDSLGVKMPTQPAEDATDEEKSQYETAKAAFNVVLEAARERVDRIAFAGQVPVNVLGATPGQYIVPVENDGSISSLAKNEADMTLAEYMRAVGKVIAIESDGRARVIVKVS
jgi:hypothetical protein